MILFSSLPDDYDHLISTLEALDENQCFFGLIYKYSDSIDLQGYCDADWVW